MESGRTCVSIAFPLVSSPAARSCLSPIHELRPGRVGMTLRHFGVAFPSPWHAIAPLTPNGVAQVEDDLESENA